MTAALIAKLESASEGDIDACDEALAQWLYENPSVCGGLVNYDPGLWLERHGGWLHSIDAALALAERVLPGWSWGIATDHERGFGCVMTPDEKSDRSFAVWASTPALAICAAILRASAAEGAE